MNSIEVPPTSLLSQDVIVITRMRGYDKLKSLQKSLSITSNLNDSKTNINKSKVSQFKNIKSEPNIMNRKIKDNIKYTMFTSNDSSNIMLVSKKPIKGSTINEALKVCSNLYEFHNSILNETTLLEYDKIYNETHSIEKIYNEVIKDNIAQLFNKKNSCVLFFGPSSSGKSYLFIGEKEENCEKINNYKSKISKNNNNNKKLEGGLLKRSINNLLNLIKMNKQGNDIKDNIQNKYEIKLSIYQIYMDKIYDLLNKKISNISIQKFYDDDEAININLVGLTDVKISSIQEYEKAIKDAELNRKNLPQILKAKNINKNSHIVISLKLQRIIQNTIGNNISDNYTINSFSQIDFVELVSSEIGLNDNFQDNNNDLSYEFSLYNNTKNVYDSIIDNIICSSNGTTPKNETMLTLSLKNTLKTNSNIIFFNCVIPWEYPINNSYKSLKFATWLRNQVINERGNMDNDNISANNINPNSVIMNNSNNLFNTINDTTTANSVINQNINNSYLINNQNPPPYLIQDNKSNVYQNYNNQNYNSSLNNLLPPSQSIDNGKKKNNFIIEEQKGDNNFNINEEKNIKLMRSRSGGLIINNRNNYNYKLNDIKDISNINNNNSLSQALDNNNQNNKNQLNANDKTLLTLEHTLKELEEKKLEIENKIYQEKNRNNYNPNMNASMPISSSQNIINQEDQKIKEEQDILKSDNIIMKEDINRLNEININLENEITQSRDIISDLQTENQRLIQENSSLKSKLNDYENNNYIKHYVNGQISKEEFLEKNCNERFMLECKIKELENSYNLLQKEKMQYEVDFKVLLSKYDEIKEKYEKSNYELMNNKQMHDNELYSIDNKINILSKEVERLQMENSELRHENEKYRESYNLITSERDMYKDKLEDEKYKNDILNKKIFDVENGYNQMMREKEYESYYGRNKEENHKNNKSETKKQIAQVLQNKIQQYRRERLQRKQNEDFD